MANIYQNLWILLSTTVVNAITKKKIIAPVSGSKNTSIEGIIVKINIFNINKISLFMPVFTKLFKVLLSIKASDNLASSLG